MKNDIRTQDVGNKIRIVNNAIDKYFNRCWNSSDIEPTRMQCATMRYLSEHTDRDVFQKDLESAFSISGATATNILKVMEKEGLITREPMPHDARLKKLALTDKAWALHQNAHANILRLEEGIKKDLSEEELTIFRDLLDRVAQNIVDLVEENTK